MDWRDPESHTTRVEKLAEVLARNKPFTVNDLGCGRFSRRVSLLHNYPLFEWDDDRPEMSCP